MGFLGSCHCFSTEENRKPGARPGAKLVENQPLTKSWPSARLLSRTGELSAFPLQHHPPPSPWGLHAAPLPLSCQVPSPLPAPSPAS